MKRRSNEEDLGTFILTVNGFKPFSNLHKDLMIVANYDLNQYWTSRLNNNILKEGMDLTSRFNYNTTAWTEKVSVYLTSNNTKLLWDKTSDGRTF